MISLSPARQCFLRCHKAGDFRDGSDGRAVGRGAASRYAALAYHRQVGAGQPVSGDWQLLHSRRDGGAARIVVTDVADGARSAEALASTTPSIAVSAPERVEAWYANKGSRRDL